MLLLSISTGTVSDFIPCFIFQVDILQTDKMPVRGNTFKIFVGNLSDRATSNDIRELFEAHGTVVESDVVKNYGFIHMENSDEGKAAIEALNCYVLHGKVCFSNGFTVLTQYMATFYCHLIPAIS